MEYQLSVDRNHLLNGLKRIQIPRKIRRSQKAILGFDGRFFSIEALNCVIVASAYGMWPGNACVSAQFVCALALGLPAGDPVNVVCDGEHLRLGTLTISCTWQPVSETLLDVPAAPDWIEALSLKYRASRGRILADRLAPEIAKAERKLAAVISKVAKSLAPLGITEKDIQALIDERLVERYAGHR